MANKFAVSTVFSAVNKVSTVVKKMTADVGGLGVIAERTKGALRGVGRVGVGMAKGIGIASAGVALVGKSFLEAGDEVEKYKTTLNTMLGSQELANKRFEEYQKFNLKTPFELSEIVDLGNSLQALGRYSVENMTVLGDLAAAAGKPVDQASRAFAKLASGQKGIAVDMFRDLLITTQDWVKATGKGVSKSGEMLATTEEMLAVLPKILKEKGFSGMMEQQSKTFNGKLSNMKDGLFQFRAAMGTAILGGASDLVGKATAFLGDLVDTVNAHAEEISKFFNGFFEMFAELFQSGVKFIRKLAPVLQKLAPIMTEVIRKMTPAFTRLLDAAVPVISKIADAFMEALPTLTDFATTITDLLTFGLKHWEVLLQIAVGIKAISLAMALASGANPWMLAIGATAALVMLIVNNWDKISSFFDGIAGMNQQAGGSGNVADYAVAGGAAAEMYGTPISSQTSTINRTTRNTLDVNVNNNTPYGVSARSTGPAAPPVTVNTGSMRHPRGL